jgi:hypothetical protein
MDSSGMVFTLPGGYVDPSGVVHREFELSPLTGRDEEYLCAMAGNALSAHVVTGLLGRCIRRLGSLRAMSEEVAREMLVGDREYVVMKIRQITWGRTVNAVLRCPSKECNKPMDVMVSLHEMAAEPRPVKSRYFRKRLRSIPSTTIKFRLPTGADQEALTGFTDEGRAVTTLLARCTGLAESEVEVLPEAARREIEEHMEKLAPQADFELETTCPECGRLFLGQAGWPAHCLSEMVSQSAILEHDIHFLAWHYHWSESDVLTMTRTKRRRYVDLIEQELDRMSRE